MVGDPIENRYLTFQLIGNIRIDVLVSALGQQKLGNINNLSQEPFKLKKVLIFINA